MRRRLAGIVATAMAGIALSFGIAVGAATVSSAAPLPSIAHTWFDM